LYRSTLAKRVWLLFFLAIIASYFYGLGRPPLLGPDEPRYAQVAREMFERGDLVTPTLSGHTWFEKPALLYWMMIASYHVFGVNEFAARFGPACSGLFSILLLFWIGRRAERATEEKDKPRGLGQWSSLALATTVGMIGFSRGASADVVVTMTVTLALACFYVSEVERDARRRMWLLAGFYAAVGASLLAKGLVGIVIPFGVVATYFLARRKWPDRRVMLSLLWGLPLFIAIASTWYGPVIARHGWLFIDDFFLQHHLARFVSNKYHHPQPVYFYVLVMIMLVFPWTPFVVGAFRDNKPNTWRKNDAINKLHVFAMAWLIVPVLFFSLSVSKLPGYVLPALPGAVLLAGAGLVRYLRGEGNTLVMRITALLVLCVTIAGTLYAQQMQLISNACIVLTATPLALSSIFGLLRAHQRRASVIVLVFAMLASTVIAVSCIGDRIGDRESVRSLIQLASARGYKDSPVYGLHTIDHTAEFYAAGRFVHTAEGKPLRLEGPQQVLTAAKETNRAVLVIVPVEHLEQLTAYAQVDADVIGDNGSVALVAVRAK
jgi:4-amino-4-deoxy-L-arabinose transferase-like glycosyltransferase